MSVSYQGFLKNRAGTVYGSGLALPLPSWFMSSCTSCSGYSPGLGLHIWGSLWPLLWPVLPIPRSCISLGTLFPTDLLVPAHLPTLPLVTGVSFSIVFTELCCVTSSFLCPTAHFLLSPWQTASLDFTLNLRSGLSFSGAPVKAMAVRQWWGPHCALHGDGKEGQDAPALGDLARLRKDLGSLDSRARKREKSEMKISHARTLEEGQVW